MRIFLMTGSKSLEQRIKILTERLKISEEKLNSYLHTKYFGDNLANQNSCHHCSYRPHPCSGSQTSSSLSSATCGARGSLATTDDLDKLVKIVDSVKAEILGVRASLLAL